MKGPNHRYWVGECQLSLIGHYLETRQHATPEPYAVLFALWKEAKETRLEESNGPWRGERKKELDGHRQRKRCVIKDDRENAIVS